MGASLKHKILTLALIFSASSALAGHKKDLRQLEATLTASCDACSFGPASSDPLGPQNSGLFKRINVFSADGKDPRHAQERTGAGAVFSAIGIVKTSNPVTMNEDGKKQSGFVQSTAFLISPCLVMTNYHAVFGNETPQPSAQNPKDFSHYNVEFSVGGTSSGQGFKYNKIVATPIAWGTSNESNNYSSDWAILKLPSAQCAGMDPDVGYLDLLTASDSDIQNATLTSAGYPGDLNPSNHQIANNKLFRQDSCRAYEHQANSDRYQTDCPSRFGDSGAPIIKMVAGVPKVVGLQVSSLGETVTIQKSFSSQHANEMLSISKVASDIKNQYGGNLYQPINSDISINGRGRPQTALVETASASL